METTAYRPSRESRAFDSDHFASRPPTASSIRAQAARADLSDDPMPLFLSDPLGEPDPREYEPLALRSRTRLVPRLLAAVLAISAAAILAALFQSDLRGLVAAYADRSTGAVQANTQAPIKDPVRVTNTMLASADTQSLPGPSAPSREAIATAYQIALQAQAPTPAPLPVAAQPAPPAPVRTLDADTLTGLMTRARSMIGVGDIVAARLLLERAANASDAAAALLLAQTYDPTVLGTSDARSIIADASVARDWYQRAATLGSAEAQQRLARLSN
ncbi:hypothetical protein [Bradyrhizobium betae]|uniref:Sel1 repeat family protein n=1 Tax=Bradyrhizobium betae TaxID=244734 RepID=A0A5P6P5Y6_9BRAD|nr:hypothetical protein [Bradyrhizobium betae]MCS3729462.1 hypothetical protein [Bradyrhizobium betae]QFI73767.1 hypothetical protein F8237_15945 [Bradyrhizobium betae]